MLKEQSPSIAVNSCPETVRSIAVLNLPLAIVIGYQSCQKQKISLALALVLVSPAMGTIMCYTLVCKEKLMSTAWS